MGRGGIVEDLQWVLRTSRPLSDLLALLSTSTPSGFSALCLFALLENLDTAGESGHCWRIWALLENLGTAGGGGGQGAEGCAWWKGIAGEVGGGDDGGGGNAVAQLGSRNPARARW